MPTSPCPSDDDGERGPRGTAVQERRRSADPTGPAPCPDRAALVDRLAAALARAERSTAVLLVDLDHFRVVNASRGHAAGDSLLSAVAVRLSDAVSGSDAVGRFGDDEFVVVCEDTGEHSAHAYACFLRNLLAEPYCVDGDTVRVTVSIGVAAAGAEAGVPAAELLRRADTAANAAKRAGEGQVRVFHQEPGGTGAERYELAADLPAALAAGDLHLEYQPVVELASGTVVGVEALARWVHPEHGLLPPSTFVGVAELTGLAPQLDRWSIRQALSDMARLRAAGALPAKASLAVNLSASNLADASLFDELPGWTTRAGLPAGLLVLEITETAIMQNAEFAARLLNRLRRLGFQIAMDDFGTGYSSLAHLRDLPITALKIDRSFVSDIAEDRDALAIVAWIVDLAEAMGVAAVAEGVETAEQAALLRGLDCATAQGWLWGPAVPVGALLDGPGWTSPLAERTVSTARAGTPGRVRADGGDAHGLSRLLELHREGMAIDTIATALDAEGFCTPAGRRWHPSAVARLISQGIRRRARRGARRPTGGLSRLR
ncbi:putative bifunctional diguanylate cyclase/phosphodiesterase [Geodermatophilus sp. CPCC 206100]|uniref:putative bifunctional diguanylate cyclase/phosphodiesterase n=1 Tax=Geodermatophilus sp. CPCC 206100 TaxID=3020054 RepID=UPI003AFFC799